MIRSKIFAIPACCIPPPILRSLQAVVIVIFLGNSWLIAGSPAPLVPLSVERVDEIRKAAEAGSVEAQVEMGRRYTEGVSATINLNEAFRWFRRAADQGDAVAQYNLGLCYTMGSVTPQDFNEAAKWFRKGAEQGNLDAQTFLGLYYSGRAAPLDYAESSHWLREPARKGDSLAQLGLGLNYFKGWEGVSADSVEGAKWIRMSAAQGNREAQYVLGKSYVDGKGVPKDDVLAYMWLNLASAAAENSPAAKDRDSVASKMSREEIAEAQRMSRGWRSTAELEAAVAPLLQNHPQKH